MYLSKNHFFNKLKTLYLKDSIMQFWASYLIVIMIPLFIVIFGFKSSFNIIEDDLTSSNLNRMINSKNLIDADIKSMELKILQVSRDTQISLLSEEKNINGQFYLNAFKTIREYDNIMRYATSDLITDSYVYMANSNYVIYKSALYSSENFSKYIKDEYNFTNEEWKKFCLRNNSAYYISINGHLQYIKTLIDEDNNEIIGAIVCEINQDRLKKLLNIDDNSNKSVFIYDNNDNLIWCVDKLGKNDFIRNNMEFNKTISYVDNMVLLNVKSDVNGWKIKSAIPENIILEKLNNIKLLVIILIVLAIIIGIIVSLYMSIKKGRPINDIFNIYGDSFNCKNIGEIVSKIVRSNKELIQEIENEKPMLKHAFFNRLVKGDFINDKEIEILAKKIDLNINNSNFRVISFRIFMNNDLYEADYQTMEEVQIISHLIQKEINDKFNDMVWFYEKDYLTTLAIINTNIDIETIKEISSDIHDKIYSECSIDSTWGISHSCNDILKLWRACEEANVANSSCAEERIIVYNRNLEDKNKFYYPELLEEQIINAIHSGDKINTNKLLDMLYVQNIQKRHIEKKNLKKLTKKIYNTITSNFTFALTDELKKKIDINFNNIDISENDCFNNIKDICKEICNAYLKKKDSNRSRLINDIVSYINKEYSNPNLGLAIIASSFNISEGYVSTIFKNNVGINFAEYVEKVRITKACESLLSSQIKISDIAEMVGYNSVQSFRRAFKKVKGISPKELRSKYNK